MMKILGLVPTNGKTLYRYLRNESDHCRLVDPLPLQLIELRSLAPFWAGWTELTRRRVWAAYIIGGDA